MAFGFKVQFGIIARIRSAKTVKTSQAAVLCFYVCLG